MIGKINLICFNSLIIKFNHLASNFGVLKYFGHYGKDVLCLWYTYISDKYTCHLFTSHAFSVSYITHSVHISCNIEIGTTAGVTNFCLKICVGNHGYVNSHYTKELSTDQHLACVTCNESLSSAQTMMCCMSSISPDINLCTNNHQHQPIGIRDITQIVYLVNNPGGAWITHSTIWLPGYLISAVNQF